MNYKQNQTNPIFIFFTDKKFILERNILFLLIILIISAEIAFNGLYDGFIGQWCIFISFIFITLFLILFNLYYLAPKYLLKNKLTRYFSLLLISIFFAFTLIIISQYFVNLLDSIDRKTYLYSTSLINIFSALIILGFGCVSSSTFLLFQQWIFNEQRIQELKNINSQSEIEQLKNQINPHFLFNMLNNVNVLTKKNPKEASIVLHKLSDLLKYQIHNSSKHVISLNEDIQFLTDFLNLEKIRRDYFEFSLSVKGNNFITIPPLLFIPFVENAVKHNIDSEKSTFIHINFEISENTLIFSCINSQPEKRKNYLNGGLGLLNIKRRLELLYPDKHILYMENKSDLYIVNLTISNELYNRR
ncbi:histidine kinase [Apibacter raozihei]|uniref:sensor histidine kinase n=1 Tax=Apibacter raozihei TaxID=2500547 RepID=UPI000FE3E0F8|nr:histidine kinase [Apibacter raozihei]